MTAIIMETIEILETLELKKDGNDSSSVVTPSKNTTRLDKNLFYILIALIFLFPLFFVPLLGVAVDFEKTLLLVGAMGLSALVWILARLKSGLYTIPKTPLLLAGVLLVGAFGLSALFSPVPHVSFLGTAFESGTVIAILGLFLTFFFSSLVFQSEYRITIFYKALLASFLVLFLFHLSRFIFGADFLAFNIFTTEALTPLGKWNDFGIFAGMIALFSICALEFGAPSKLSRMSVYAILIAALLVLVVVNFTFLWILLGVFTLILSVYNFTVNRKSGGELASGLATPSLFVLIVSILFVISGNSLGNTLAGYTNTPQLEVRPSWESTLTVLSETWSISPLLGTGPNRFTSAWLLHKPEGVNQTFFWNTNFNAGIGTLPSYMITTGLLGALALLLFLVLYFYQGIRIVFREGEKVHYFTLSLFLVSVYLWLVALLYIPNITILFYTFTITGAFIAFSVYRGYISSLNLTHLRDARIGFVSVLILIILLVGVVDLGYITGQKSLSLYYFHKAVTANNVGERDLAGTYLTKATTLNQSDRFYRAQTELELLNLNELLTRENARPEQVRAAFQQTLGNAIRAAQNAVAYDRNNYLNWLSLFQVYGNVVQLNAVEGAYENAVKGLSEAQALNPQSPLLLLRKAELEIAAGNTESAREALEEALTLKEDYTDAIFLLAQLEISEGNTQAAVRSLEQVSLIDPNNVGVFFSLGLLYYNDRSYVSAIEALERVTLLNPAYSNAKYYLALSYYANGRVEDAKNEFEEISVLNPGNELIANILNNLSLGEAPLSGIGEEGGATGQIEPPLTEE